MSSSGGSTSGSSFFSKLPLTNGPLGTASAHILIHICNKTQGHQHNMPCNELTPWLALGANADGWSHVWDCSWILNNEQSWKIGIRLNLTTPN